MDTFFQYNLFVNDEILSDKYCTFYNLQQNLSITHTNNINILREFLIRYSYHETLLTIYNANDISKCNVEKFLKNNGQMERKTVKEAGINI